MRSSNAALNLQLGVTSENITSLSKLIGSDYSEIKVSLLQNISLLLDKHKQIETCKEVVIFFRTKRANDIQLLAGQSQVQHA